MSIKFTGRIGQFLSPSSVAYTAQILKFEIEGDGLIEPADLAQIEVPPLEEGIGVVISGRGPIWLYSYLVHELHPFPWVACHDPRLGAVVTQRHHKSAPPIGEVLKLPQ